MLNNTQLLRELRKLYFRKGVKFFQRWNPLQQRWRRTQSLCNNCNCSCRSVYVPSVVCLIKTRTYVSICVERKRFQDRFLELIPQLKPLYTHTYQLLRVIKWNGIFIFLINVFWTFSRTIYNCISFCSNYIMFLFDIYICNKYLVPSIYISIFVSSFINENNDSRVSLQ